MSDLGVVIIGRNEGERLRRCLESVVGRGHAVVYVDSGSTDGSPSMAESLGAEVVALDLSTPFTAARARNAGVARLDAIRPGLAWFQFVDGDCVIEPGWIDRARAELEARPNVVAIAGRLREQHPERSVYNRLADLEWTSPTAVGEVEQCGGIAMFRAGPFREVGGFDPSIPAGEEPELCRRLIRRGWKVVRLDVPMARHDLAMTRFGQWWRRSVRSTYGAWDVIERFGGDGDPSAFADFRRQVRSAVIWSVGWPSATIVAGLVGAAAVGPAAGLAAAGVLATAPLAQMARLSWKIRRRAGRPSTAIAYGVLQVVGKVPQALGLWLYARDRRRGRSPRLIEHKAASSAASASPTIAAASTPQPPLNPAPVRTR